MALYKDQTVFPTLYNNISISTFLSSQLDNLAIDSTIIYNGITKATLRRDELGGEIRTIVSSA